MLTSIHYEKQRSRLFNQKRPEVRQHYPTVKVVHTFLVISGE